MSSSITCGDNELSFEAVFAFSNPEGTLTATALVEIASDWLTGVRKINGSSLQVDTECPIVISDSERGRCISRPSDTQVIIAHYHVRSCCTNNQSC